MLPMPPEAPQYDLVGFGIAAVDDILELREFPKPGSKGRILSNNRCGGGLCTTALVAAARLGLRCYYAGILGRNDLSDFTRQVLSREGIAYSEAILHPEARPVHSVILVERSTGERTILYSYEGLTGQVPGEVPYELAARARALFVDHLAPECGRDICAFARERSIPTIADIEVVNSAGLHKLVEAVDHLIIPLRLAVALSGCSDPAAATRAVHQGRPCTAVTDGARGCWFAGAQGEVQHQSAFPVCTIDTTGCGDVFHGAYAAGLVSGLPLADRIRFASAAAALKATRLGGQAGIPNRPAVEAFLAEQAPGRL